VSTTDEDTTAAWKRVVNGSGIVSTVRRVWTGELNPADNARSAQVIERGAQWLTGSILYRWLTAEPEPDVIVIDLRETWTVGPLLDLLDRLLLWVLPYWEASRVSDGVGTLIRLVERAAATRYGQAIVSVLAPPKPPADERGGEPHPVETKGSQQSGQLTASTRKNKEPTSDAADGDNKNSHGRQ
jgi:hypothetical protein